MLRRARPGLFGGIVALSLTATSSTAAADPDPWLGEDKAKHFGASAAIAAGGYSLGAMVFEERSSALILGGSLALTAGVGKEVYDAAGHGMASERDLVWDVAGTATGLAVAWLVDILVRGDLDNSSDEETTAGPGAAVTFRF